MRAWKGLALLGSLLLGTTAARQQPVAMKVPAPEFQEISAWINTKPLKLANLRGQVVVLHYWAFG